MTDDYELIAVGDSAMWGMGLDHGDKYVNRFYEEYLTSERLGEERSGEPLPEENIKAQVGAVLGVLEDPADNELDHTDIDSYLQGFRIDLDTLWEYGKPVGVIRRFEQTYALAELEDFDEEGFVETLELLEENAEIVESVAPYVSRAADLAETDPPLPQVPIDTARLETFDDALETLAALSTDERRRLYLTELLDWSEHQRRAIAQKHGRESTERIGRKGVGHGTPTIPQQIENLPYDFRSDGDESLMSSLNFAVGSEETPLSTSELEDETGLEAETFTASYADDGSEADVDIVVMNGSINDLGSTNPLEVPFGYKTRLDHASRSFSYIGLKRSIRQVHETFPEATIYVCGYFPPMSFDSDPADWDLVEFAIEHAPDIVRGLRDEDEHEDFLETKYRAGFKFLARLPFGRSYVDSRATEKVETEINSLLRELRSRYEYFYKKMTFEMRRAVADLDADLDVPVLFVDPGFKRENATEATDPWLFGLPQFTIPFSGLEAPEYFDPDPEAEFEFEDDPGLSDEEHRDLLREIETTYDDQTDLDARSLASDVITAVVAMDDHDIASPHLLNFLSTNFTNPNYGSQIEDRKEARETVTKISNHDTGYEYRNSLAHPNAAGAAAYYEELRRSWIQNFEDGWSLRTECERLRSEGEADGGIRVRDVIEPYEPLLNLADGVRACFNMTRVDSIKIELETGSVGIDGNFERTHLDIQIGDEEFVRFNLNPDPDHSLTQGAVRRRSPGEGHPNAPNVLQGVPEERDHLVIDPIFDDAKVVTGSERATDLDSPGSNELYTNSEPLQVGDIEGISIHWGDEIDEDAMEAHELQNSPEGPLIVGWTVANGTLWINGRVVGELDEAVFGVTVPDIEGDSQAVGTTVSFESVFDS